VVRLRFTSYYHCQLAGYSPGFHDLPDEIAAAARRDDATLRS
jgi:hypothetical protein